jgi:spore germination protein KA
MKKKGNALTSLLSIISYKVPKDTKEFYIPEVIDENDRESGKEQNDNNQENITPKNEKAQSQNNSQDNENDSIPCDINLNLNYLKKSFNYHQNKDIKLREFKIGGRFKAFIIYIDGMVDRNIVNRDILRPLLREREYISKKECNLEYILNSVIETNEAERVTTFQDVIFKVLMGDTGVYVDGCNYYIFSETKGYDKRAVDKPQTEGVISGSQEAFSENLRTNTVLIRRIIKNNNLVTEYMKIGERSNTLCAIMYINGLVNPALVKEIKRRLSSISTDLVLGSGMLEQFIEDEAWSLIPTILNTERPDRAASHLFEGKVALIADGDPAALIVPITLSELLHSPEDTSVRWPSANLLRFIRAVAIFVATFLPGLYIAVTNFHQEMIPTELLIAIASARENVPLPTILEVLLMEMSFELIREAGVRVPGTLGSTIGIIGALILGQAAVQASIISPILIIIVAITGLGNFAIPNVAFSFGIRIIRVLFILAGATLGFYGITVLLITLEVIIVDMKSFGVPFLSLIAPKERKSYDFLRRQSIWKQELRPDYTNPLDVRRQPDISRQWTVEEPDDVHERGDSSD